MSWFSSDTKERKEIARQQELAQQAKIEKQKSIQRAQQVQWMRSKTATDFIELFNTFEQQVKSVVGEPSELEGDYKRTYRASLDGLAQIRKAFFEIDRGLLNEHQLISLYGLLSQVLPNAISNLQKHSIEGSIYRAWEYDGAKEYFSNAFTSLIAVRNSQIGINPTVLPKTEITGDTVFPAYEIADSSITEPLARIGKLWRQASEKKNTVENEYFLEQVVSSYLPEAYRLYSTFQLAPAELQESAATIFVEQLELIERHLVHILRTYMEQNLVAMQNHMDFLKQKTLDSAEKPELLEIAAT